AHSGRRRLRSWAHQVLEHGFQVVIFREYFAKGQAAVERQGRQAGVEGVGLARFNAQSRPLVQKLNADDVVEGGQARGERPRLIADEDDAVRVLVDQVANLAD